MNAQPTIDEVCPNCGAWTPTLDDHTGWCHPCANHQQCNRCHTWHPLEQYRPHRNTRRATCRTCERLTEAAHREANRDRERARSREKATRRRARERAAKATRQGAAA